MAEISASDLAAQELHNAACAEHNANLLFRLGLIAPETMAAGNLGRFTANAMTQQTGTAPTQP